MHCQLRKSMAIVKIIQLISLERKRFFLENVLDKNKAFFLSVLTSQLKT